MELTERNFIRLLCCGIFGSDDTIEPMSYWKWQRLFRMSLNHGVSALVYDGIENHNGDFGMNIPDDIRDSWKTNVKEIEQFSRNTTGSTANLIRQFQKDQLRPIILKGASMATLYPTPEHRTGGDCDILFLYEPQAAKADEWVRANASRVEQKDNYTLAYLWDGMMVENHRQMSRLTNIWLNRRLQNIIDKETRCCDSTYVYIGDIRVETPSPTLSLLMELVRIARYMVNDGLKLKQLVDLGVMLRTIGAKVDFVKLQNWIDMLHMQKITTMEGTLLMTLFDFTDDELPFFNPRLSSDATMPTNDLLTFNGKTPNEWYFTQGTDIFVSSRNPKALMWQISRAARYFRYYPLEVTTSFIHSFSHSLSHIEE